MSLCELDRGNLPKHIAIIMDGNGRWAKKQKKVRIAGHKKGITVARTIVEACARKKIDVLTLFAFGQENWGRPKAEVDFLMELFLIAMGSEAQRLYENNVQLRIVGGMDSLPDRLAQKMFEVQRLTLNNTGLKLVIAINYSGRWDIVQATKRIVNQVQSQSITINDVTPALIQQSLCLSDLPDPDLLIRTSGEQRISNFMLWQVAYTELFFTPVLWPDFTEEHFESALAFFSSRRRRFGLV